MKGKNNVLYDIKHSATNNSLFVLLAASVIASNAYYWTYEKNTQIIESSIDNNDYFINEQGEICKVFKPGEHRIEISRNDAYYRKIEEIPGYTIKEVTIHAWRDNNHTIYANTIPIIAKGTIDKNGKIIFNQFGEITIELEEPKLRLER